MLYVTMEGWSTPFLCVKSLVDQLDKRRRKRGDLGLDQDQR